MAYKILIMGLPGSGKTTFAEKLISKLTSTLWLNADNIRESHNDWDFSKEGRLRQAHRLTDLSNESDCNIVVCDFIAPLAEHRDIFNADYMIWMNTISAGIFKDTNTIFEPPKEVDYMIVDFNSSLELHITNILKTAICLNI